MSALLPLLGVGAVAALLLSSKKSAAGRVPPSPGVLDTEGDDIPPYIPGPPMVVPGPGGQPVVVPSQIDPATGQATPMPVLPPPSYVPPAPPPSYVPPVPAVPPWDQVSPGLPQPTQPGQPTQAQQLAMIADAMAKVVQQGDPVALRAYAQTLRSMGMIAQAQALESLAASIELARQAPAAPPSPMPVPPPMPVPVPVPVPPPSAEDPRKKLASDLYSNLLQRPTKGTEDKALVGAFQRQEGTAKIDSLYGPETAAALTRYGIVPPTPRYWSGPVGKEWDVEASKRDYRNLLTAKRNADPARYEEWDRALRAV